MQNDEHTRVKGGKGWPMGGVRHRRRSQAPYPTHEKAKAHRIPRTTTRRPPLHVGEPSLLPTSIFAGRLLFSHPSRVPSEVSGSRKKPETPRRQQQQQRKSRNIREEGTERIDAATSQSRTRT